MAEESDSGEKTEEPSQYRIDEFRKKGQVAQSKEVNSLLVLSACIMATTLSGVYVYEVFTEFIYWLMKLDPAKAYSEKLIQDIIRETAYVGLKCIAPVFVTSFVISIFSQLSQIGFIYAPDVLQLKFDRINPLNGAKRLFSMNSIAEVAKGMFKFSIILSITYFMLQDSLTTFVGFLHVELPTSLEFGQTLALKLAYGIILGLIVVAMGDFAWQKYSHLKKMRMTKQEVKDESKEKEGNPEIKQKIKAIQREMSQKRMMADVPSADAIVTNPTHLSVAIRYNPKEMIAPEVIAKGADNVALRIREIAKENQIPIVENVPLARTLYKTVKVGEGVPRTLYKAVAEVLAFVYRKKRKKKALDSGLRG
jgi:flagellar biosynthetic protein FlhB